VLSEDPGEFTKRIASAKPIIEFFLAEISEKEHDPHRLLRVAETIVLPLLQAIPSPMEREHFIQATARALSLSSEAVRESLKNVPKLQTPAAGTTTQGPAASRRSGKELRSEQLRAVIHAYQGMSLAKRVESEYSRITEAPVPSEPSSEPALFNAEQAFGEEPTEDAADELLHAFEEAVVREAYQSAVQSLRRAEASGDTASVSRAQALCASLSERLSALSS
jgi:DNA primase